MTEAVIAIDPGARSGVAVVSVEAVPRLMWIGKWTGADGTPSALIRRLVAAALEQGHEVGQGYIEKQYVGHDPDAALKVCEMAGRWIEACTDAGLVVSRVHPQTWQARMLVGLCSGRAKRKERKAASRHLARLRWHRELSEDEADAAVMGAYAAEVLHGQNRRRR